MFPYFDKSQGLINVFVCSKSSYRQKLSAAATKLSTLFVFINIIDWTSLFQTKNNQMCLPSKI